MQIAPLTPIIHATAQPGSLPGWQVRQVTAYIDANLDATLRTTSLAASVGLSVSHFTRAFKRSVGVPPRVFVIRRRLAAACTAMLASDAPLTAIAHAHGFCDQSHFTRTFHDTIGIAPHAWRRGQAPRHGVCYVDQHDTVEKRCHFDKVGIVGAA